jgi:hypothetical protein
LAAQIQTDKNSIISDPVLFTDHKISTHQLLSNNAQHTCLTAKQKSYHTTINNNNNVDNSIPFQPNIQYNNYLHVQHTNDTDHQMSPNIPNKTFINFIFSKHQHF